MIGIEVEFHKWFPLNGSRVLDSSKIFNFKSKFKNEAPGLCCAGEKAKFQELHPPPEPLSTLSGDTSISKLFLANICKYNSYFQMTSFKAMNIVRAIYYMQHSKCKIKSIIVLDHYYQYQIRKVLKQTFWNLLWTFLLVYLLVINLRVGKIYSCTRQKEEQKILCIQMHLNNFHSIEYLNCQTFLDKTNKIT